ncbi:MAG: hypothetical protein M1826_005862 [Phylliscum demangeonii]|nr:MAG: hypothetical protein M1826_005862 [Phylliscum demangeonii]
MTSSTTDASPPQPQPASQQEAHWHDSRAASVLALVVVLTTMATIATAARLVARRLSKVPLQADDYTLGLALVLVFGLGAATIASVHNGLGRHQYAVDVAALENFSKSQYAFVVLYSSCVMLVKISILLLYRTLFVTPSFRATVLMVGGYVTVLGVVSTTVTLFKCRRISDGWKIVGLGECINDVTFFRSTGALNLLADLVILLLPLPVVWRLQLVRKQKLALTAIFALGILVDPESWSIIEPCVGIICACLPTLGPLLRAIGRRCRRKRRRPGADFFLYAPPSSLSSLSSSPAIAPGCTEMARVGSSVHVRSGGEWAPSA